MSGAGATGSSGLVITSSALMFMSSSKVLPPVSAAPALTPALEFNSSGAGTCSVATCHQLCNHRTMQLSAQLSNYNQPHQLSNQPSPSLILLLTGGPDEQQGERQPWWERPRVQGNHCSPRRPGGRLFRGVCIAPQAAAPSVLLCFATVCVCARAPSVYLPSVYLPSVYSCPLLQLAFTPALFCNWRARLLPRQ